MRLAGSTAAGRAATLPFWVYVEGPRDRDVLCAWARRGPPHLSRSLEPALVILGGRQPARAAAHLRKERARERNARGLCVLDRDGDDHGDPKAAHCDEPGLAFFTWTRRHIESYLLVPAAIQRALRLSPHDGRVERYFREQLPAIDDEVAWRGLAAKKLFSPRGELARLLGRAVPPGKIARAMREEELHCDVRELLALLGEGLGVRDVETAHRRA